MRVPITMVSRVLWNLNRRVDILYRYVKGEPVEEIARSYGMSPRSVQDGVYRSRINPRICDSVQKRLLLEALRSNKLR